MRILLTGLAALTLAGCHASAPEAANSAAPTEAQVESEFQNQQDALAASIENDANVDDAEEANLDGPTAYSCDSGIALTVVYADNGNASLTTGGRTVALTSMPSASGSKYHADTGLAAGKSLTWWTKGDSAVLIEAPKGAKEGAGETTVNCLATNPDQ